MIQTSETYRPFPIVREVNCKISFGVIDQSAVKGDAVIAGNDSGFVGDLSDTVNDVAEPTAGYASLERNAWTLDGSLVIMPDDASGVETGWWSNAVSGADGTFSAPPYIRYTFDNPISTLGWTLHYDIKARQWADRVRITAYDSGGNVVDDDEYDISEPLGVVQHYTGDYYAVQVTFLHTSEPFRRVRLVEFDFGITKYYDRNSIGTASLKYALDPLSKSLSSRELIFTIDNSDKQYNLLNPDGVYQYLQDGQKIRAKITIGNEDVDMGEFFFTSADVSGSYIAPTITAHDRIYILDADEYNDGADTTTTLSAAVTAVIGAYNIPVQYDDGIGSTPVTMAIPQNTTRREAVRMLAQAARATAWIARDGILHFSRVSAGGAVGDITGDELHDWSGVSIADKVDGVRLTVQNAYRWNAEREEYGVSAVYTSGSGERITNFSNPCVADSQGQAVADWLLETINHRKKYAVKNRCDPSVEIGDTVRITDAFGNHGAALVTGLEIRYDGALYAITEGVGD